VFGKMSNSKWQKVFDELLMHEVTIKSCHYIDEKLVCPAEICNICLFAYGFPNSKINYKDIIYMKCVCSLDKATDIQKLGIMDTTYQDGILLINGY